MIILLHFLNEDTQISQLEILRLNLAQVKSEWLYACLDKVNQISRCARHLMCTLVLIIQTYWDVF